MSSSRFLNPTSPGGLLSPSGGVTLTATELLDVQKIGANTFFYDNEQPSEIPNGSTFVFHTLHTIKPLGNEVVTLNGIKQQGGGSDYTASGTNTITFVVAPVTGSIILISYRSQA